MKILAKILNKRAKTAAMWKKRGRKHLLFDREQEKAK